MGSILYPTTHAPDKLYVYNVYGDQLHTPLPMPRGKLNVYNAYEGQLHTTLPMLQVFFMMTIYMGVNCIAHYPCHKIRFMFTMLMGVNILCRPLPMLPGKCNLQCTWWYTTLYTSKYVLCLQCIWGSIAYPLPMLPDTFYVYNVYGDNFRNPCIGMLTNQEMLITY